jgi:hypothetical protein
MDRRINKTKVKLTQIPEVYSKSYKNILKRVVHARSLQEIGDVETLNQTQLGKLKEQGFKFQILNEEIEISKFKEYLEAVKIKNFSDEEIYKFAISLGFKKDMIEVSRNGKDKDNFEHIWIVTGDRGPRTDHGGGKDGDGWLDSYQIEHFKKPYVKKYADQCKKLEKFFKGYKTQIDYGEKGHISIVVSK